METATVTLEGNHRSVHLPKGFHRPAPTVFIRHEGDSIVLETMKAKAWPAGFFEAIRITDPAFARPEQGSLPPLKLL